MEKQVKIKTPDKKVIYGVLNWKKKTDKLVIFIHGLTGHPNEHHLKDGSKYLTSKGYATFRFNLYSMEKDGRRFSEVTLQYHAEDLETVIKYFAKKYKHIHLIGHSLGGPTILLANLTNIRSIVLWDPSERIKDTLSEWTTYDSRIDMYIIHWEIDILLNKRLYQDMLEMPSMVEAAQKLTVPMRVILADQDGKRKKLWKKFNEIRIIPKANHTFDVEGVDEKLFKETLDWIRRF